MMPYPPPQVLIGPYFVRTPALESPSASAVSIGASLEFSTPSACYSIPLYRKVCSYDPEKFNLSSIVIHPKDIPCDVEYRLFYSVESSEGTFVPLDAVLVGMVHDFTIERSAWDILGDLAETLRPAFDWRRLPGLLKDSFEQDGFGISMIDTYGRYVKVILSWSLPVERGKDEEGAVLVSWMDFRPKADGTLGYGSWKEPFKDSFSNVLYQTFRRKNHSHPVDLLSEFGKRNLLAYFEWTPLARMTPKEARVARVKFISQNPDLKSNPKQLAEKLRAAGLYASSTSLHQVLKFLPSLISESDVGQEP